jgi:2-dehydro-3-deoxyphosphogluconate aldolase/(4S)-4-hydroxy-2-oxoglutarate aldolase
MNTIFKKELVETLYRQGVIAVLVIDNVADAVPLARCLLDSGIRAMELTLRTSVAFDALNEIKSKVPEMVAGIGTVITTAQVEQISQAGVEFGVAPGMNRKVVKRAIELGLAFAPGIATPSDIEAALEFNCEVLKFFPAEPLGGLSYLKSIVAPYSHLGIRYIALGGINQENLEHYLCDSNILAVGGSWIATKELIKKRDWQTIAKRARMAYNVVKTLRGDK